MSQQTHSELAIHPATGDDGHELLQRKQVARRTRIFTIVVLVLLALGAGRTVISRINNAKTLEANVKETARPYVRVARVRSATTGQNIALPGSLQGYVQSPVAARAGGYLRRWYKDIGSRVQKGELLAEIETPELDQQLSQAVAAQQQQVASMDLAKSTMERWEALRKRDAVSQQELEERRSAFAQAQANLAAAVANVERLRQLESFKRVLAPFAGVITKRNVDIGDLIDGSGRPLFLLAQTDPLRVYINLPQAYAQLVRVGQPATITQNELPGREFKGELVRTAGAIDAATRTMQVEIALPNRDGVLLPGAFVQVALGLVASGALTVPANTLIIRADGTRVALVDPQGKVHMQQVRLGRNYGEVVEVLGGLTGQERLVLNPSDSLVEGDMVQVMAEAPAAAGASKSARAAP